MRVCAQSVGSISYSLIMAKKRYLEESERKLIESVNNAYIPTDWDEFEKRYHEMERYGDGKPRKVDKEKMEYIEDGLVSRGVGGNQLSSLLSTIVEESGGNPFSVDDSGKFRGLIQFSKERYPEKDFSRDKKAGWKKAVDNQLDAIVDHLNEYGGDYGFLDGGDGSGYMTGEEAKDAFWGRDSDIENVTRALTYGFVRPGDRSGTTENRTRVARLINEIIQPPVETPDILEFDYDGKHYKATKPEEVTPEMRRALMLSKLVGEKNKVELQDPLYTTFDEAYGRAKGKGASVFMWKGKKYSTKEDGGEVREKESSSFLDVLKKSFRARTATANLVKDIFFGSEDGKPTELNRSLFSGVDPRGEVPNWSLPGIARAIDYAWDTLAAYIEGNYKDGLSEEYKDLPIADRVAINAWAKYNHLPYDKKLIIDNGDGTFRLPKEITGKIRTDKKQIERIYNTNKSLLEKAEKKYSNQIEQAKKNNELEKIPYISEQILSDPEIELFKGALEMDKQNLAAMDSLNKNGKAVFNEFNYSGRNLRNEEDLPLLNVMGNHTIERDQNGNYRYKDIYDFWPWFDWMTRGNIFKIEGKIPHRKDGGRGALWTKEDEEDFQKWYAKVAEHKGLNPDPDDENQYYDYRTYWLENPEAAQKMLEDDPEAHFTDRYKYPGHPTFSDESMYADEEHPGGHWETVDGIGYYVPSEYTKSYIDRTIEYLAGQNEGVYIDGEYKLIPKMPDGGASRLAPRDNTSVGRPGSADVRSVKPSAAARENPVVPFVASLLPGIGDVIDAHDFIQAAKDKNMVGMALAAAGFIPLIGDAFQEAARFARGRRNSYVRYDAPPRRNDIKESDEELLRKMPDYARPGYPAMEALNVHRRRLSDGAYEQRTGQGGSEAKRELEGFAETFPGIYDRIFNLDYINEDDIDAARRVIEIIDKQPKGSAGTMSDEGVVKRLNDIKQRLVRSSPAFADGTKGNAGIISLDNWSDFFMDEAYRSGISHELDHAVYLNTPEETIKELSGKVGDWFDSSRIENKNIRDYVSKPIELLARGTQIKDFYGLTDNAEKVTPEMLKFAARHYADNVMDNQITEFFNGIKDWNKAAEWISKYSTATLPAIAVSKLLQDGKEKDEYPVNKRHGGPISEDGSVGGDYILDDGGRSLYRRSEYIKNRLLSKYNLLPEESDGIISDLIRKSSLDEKFYDPKHRSYGIGQWSGKDLKEFVLTYKDGGLVDQIDFLAKKYWDGFGKDGKGDIESGVFDEHRWVVKRIGNEEFYTNSPLLKTLPSMSREDVALSLLPPELWPGILKRKEDVTGKSARKHFISGGEVNELQDYIYDRLTKEHGIAPIQAIGIVANLTQESALDYDALGDNGRSYGIQQWQGDRRKKLFEFAKKRGRDKPALDDQVDFLVEEYKGDGFLFPTRGENMYKTGKTDKDMFDYFQYSKLDFDNASNIYDSTRAWAQGFGRGNKNFLNMDKRFHIAKTLLSRYNIDAGGQSFYTDMGYKDEWGSPVPEVAVSAEKKVAQDDWMEKYGNKMLASILAGDGEGGDTHVTNNYYVNEEGLSEDEKRNAAEVQELQQKQQAQELLASIIDGIKLDIKGVTEVRKR